MNDLISRQAAIDALEKVANMFPWRVPGNRDTYDRYNEAWNDAIGRAEMEIENMPPAQPGWIPTSERLPEGIGQVIIQTNGGAIHEVFFKGKNDYGHEVWMRLDGDIYWDDEVVAWQPLPTPYREGGQDGKN